MNAWNPIVRVSRGTLLRKFEGKDDRSLQVDCRESLLGRSDCANRSFRHAD